MLHKCVSPASQALYSYNVVTSSELATRASGRLSGFRAASAGWLVVPRSNRGLDLPIMKAVAAAADRGTGILVTCPVCLQAMCVYTGTRPNTPIAGFLRENLILLLLLRWLAGSGQGVGGSYFYFGGEKSRAVALQG